MRNGRIIIRIIPLDKLLEILEAYGQTLGNFGSIHVSMTAVHNAVL